MQFLNLLNSTIVMMNKRLRNLWNRDSLENTMSQDSKFKPSPNLSWKDPILPITSSVDPQNPIMTWTFQWDEPTGIVKCWVDIRTSEILDALDSHGNYIKHNG